MLSSNFLILHHIEKYGIVLNWQKKSFNSFTNLSYLRILNSVTGTSAKADKHLVAKFHALMLATVGHICCSLVTNICITQINVQVCLILEKSDTKKKNVGKN